MTEFFKELVGVKCDFVTSEKNYYGYILKDISGEWIAVEDASESVYLNLNHVFSIRLSQNSN